MRILSSTNDIITALGESLDLSAQFQNLSVPHILTALITATLCGLIVYLVYRFFHRGIVYSSNFNILLLLVTVVTTFVIMTISANLILSLGMVGALSIVRFRSAIKDPLDVGFLFWGIGVGITAGAGLYFIAILGTSFIAVLYIALTIFKKERRSYLLILRYDSEAEKSVGNALESYKYKLKNKTQTESDIIELTIEIKISKNDTSALSVFKAINGVKTATLLEYSGEYMN